MLKSHYGDSIANSMQIYLSSGEEIYISFFEGIPMTMEMVCDLCHLLYGNEFIGLKASEDIVFPDMKPVRDILETSVHVKSNKLGIIICEKDNEIQIDLSSKNNHEFTIYKTRPILNANMKNAASALTAWLANQVN